MDIKSVIFVIVIFSTLATALVSITVKLFVSLILMIESITQIVVNLNGIFKKEDFI